MATSVPSNGHNKCAYSSYSDHRSQRTMAYSQTVCLKGREHRMLSNWATKHDLPTKATSAIKESHSRNINQGDTSSATCGLAETSRSNLLDLHSLNGHAIHEHQKTVLKCHEIHMTANGTDSLNPLAGIQIRSLMSNDKDRVKELCRDWFPIEYPDTWYDEITSNHGKFYSVAAVSEPDGIVGLIVVDFKQLSKCDREDADLLSCKFPPSSLVAYILTLGVTRQFRRRGLATLLVRRLIDELSATRPYSPLQNGHAIRNNDVRSSIQYGAIKAIYLHVLSTNHVALHFYEILQFTAHKKLPFYYAINGSPRDGLSYVYYLNGGRPPWSWCDFLSPLADQMVELGKGARRVCASHGRVPRPVHNAVTMITRIPRLLFRSRFLITYFFQAYMSSSGAVKQDGGDLSQSSSSSSPTLVQYDQLVNNNYQSIPIPTSNEF